MTTQTEALKLALEALENSYSLRDDVIAAKAAIKEALAQPEPSPEWMTEEEQTAYTFGWFKALESQRMAQPAVATQHKQEPVAKVCHDLDGHIGWNPKLTQLPDEGTPLYTTPPQRTWVGLTPDEIRGISLASGESLFSAIMFTHDKLKEKNI